MAPPNGTPPDLSLVFPGSDGRPLVFPIPEGTVALGRAADNDLVLEDPSVEPHQVVLTRTGDHLELRGLFAGTTMVNDAPSQKTQLKPGDVITLGTLKLRLMKIAAAKSGALKRGETRSLGRGGRPTRAHPRDSDPPTRTGAAPDRTTQRMPGPDDVEGKRARERDAAEGTGIAQEIISRCLQVRSVIRVAGGYQGLGGLAAPLLTESRALGMLYFERVSTPGAPLGADDVHLMALLTNVASLKIAPLVR